MRIPQEEKIVEINEMVEARKKFDDELGKAWEGWSDATQVEWKYFCTFTYAFEVKLMQAKKDCLKLARNLTKRYLSNKYANQVGLNWVAGIEANPSKLSFHIHAAFEDPITKKDISECWADIAGDKARVDIQEYKTSSHGLKYIVKQKKILYNLNKISPKKEII